MTHHENLLLRSELPPKDTVRWSALKRTAVAKAIHYGALSIDEAVTRYGFSVDEVNELMVRFRLGAMKLNDSAHEVIKANRKNRT